MTGQGHPLTFQASLVKLRKAADGVYATFYLMNTSKNRNGWAVTDKALAEGLPTIMGKALGLGAGYVLGHFDDVIDVGEFCNYMLSAGYGLAEAKITDQVAVDALLSKAWGPISVIILSYAEQCSECGADITTDENPFLHDCIVEKTGHLLVTSFTFDRVDFVADPAYPQAGTLSVYADHVESGAPMPLAAQYYEGESAEDIQKRLAGGGQEPDQTRKSQMTDKLKAELENVKAENAKLVIKADAMEKKVSELKKQLDENAPLVTKSGDLETQVAELQTQLDDIEALRKTSYEADVAAAVEKLKAARKAAGLPDAEFVGYELPVLTAMIADAEATVTRIAELSKRRAPATTYGGATGETPLQSSIEDMREKILGRRNEAT